MRIATLTVNVWYTSHQPGCSLFSDSRGSLPTRRCGLYRICRCEGDRLTCLSVRYVANLRRQFTSPGSLVGARAPMRGRTTERRTRLARRELARGCHVGAQDSRAEAAGRWSRPGASCFSSPSPKHLRAPVPLGDSWVAGTAQNPCLGARSPTVAVGWGF